MGCLDGAHQLIVCSLTHRLVTREGVVAAPGQPRVAAEVTWLGPVKRFRGWVGVRVGVRVRVRVGAWVRAGVRVRVRIRAEVRVRAGVRVRVRGMRSHPCTRCTHAPRWGDAAACV